MSITMHNLGVVGRLLEQDKLVTNSIRFTIRPPAITREIMRRWYGEGREHSIEALNSLFSSALTLLALLHSDKAPSDQAVSKGRLERHIQKALEGVKNLKQTYRDDVDMVARLSQLEDETGERLTRITQSDGEALRNASSNDSENARPFSMTPPRHSLGT